MLTLLPYAPHKSIGGKFSICAALKHMEFSPGEGFGMDLVDGLKFSSHLRLPLLFVKASFFYYLRKKGEVQTWM